MISLIIPCYNAEEYLDRCLDSVLAQTEKDIELILVNDGSTDRTDSIVRNRRQEIEQALTKFIYLQQENQGVGAACSAAFQHATGKYLALLDSDDILCPDSMKMRKDWLDAHPDYDIVRTNGYYVSENDVEHPTGIFINDPAMKSKEYIFQDLFEGTTNVWSGSYMIRMKALDAIYPERKIYPSRSGQNQQFLMMAAYKGKAGYIDIPLMKYVRRRESLSHFSGENAMQKEVDAMKGYVDIRRYLVTHCLPAQEQSLWLERADKGYARACMGIASSHKNKPLMRESYAALKKLSGGGVQWTWTPGFNTTIS